jgi:hypothetical protein
MSARLRAIVRKQRLLIATATEQRREFALQAAAVRQSLAFADLAWRGFRHLKARPVGIAVAAAALAALGPGRLLRLGYRSGLIVVAALRLIKIFRTLR